MKGPTVAVAATARRSATPGTCVVRANPWDPCMQSAHESHKQACNKSTIGIARNTPPNWRLPARGEPCGRAGVAASSGGGAVFAGGDGSGPCERPVATPMGLDCGATSPVVSSWGWLPPRPTVLASNSCIARISERGESWDPGVRGLFRAAPDWRARNGWLDGWEPGWAAYDAGARGGLIVAGNWLCLLAAGSFSWAAAAWKLSAERVYCALD